MKNKFAVSRTYSVVSPESASRGDFEDMGFVYQNKILSFRDLIDEIDSLGYWHASDSRGLIGKHVWIEQADSDTDYENGHERVESLHFDNLTDRQFSRLVKYLVLREKQRRLDAWEQSTERRMGA